MAVDVVAHTFTVQATYSRRSGLSFPPAMASVLVQLLDIPENDREVIVAMAAEVAAHAFIVPAVVQSAEWGILLYCMLSCDLR